MSQLREPYFGPSELTRSSRFTDAWSITVGGKRSEETGVRSVRIQQPSSPLLIQVCQELGAPGISA